MDVNLNRIQKENDDMDIGQVEHLIHLNEFTPACWLEMLSSFVAWRFERSL